MGLGRTLHNGLGLPCLIALALVLGTSSGLGAATFVGTTDVLIDGNSDLLIQDGDGGDTNDTLTLSVVDVMGTNHVRVHDPNNLLNADSGTPAIRVPVTGVTQITVNALGGDDELTIDFSGGNPIPTDGLTFNGGIGGFDSMALVGETFTDAVYVFDSLHDGSIDLDGSTIHYTGLEPISSTINATNVTLNFGDTSETITVTDAGGGQTTVTSTAAESVTFNNPTGSLTINAGGGDDTIIIASLFASYPASVTIDGEAGSDAMNVNSTVSSNGNISLIADTVTIAADISAFGDLYIEAGSSDVTISNTSSITADSDISGAGTLYLLASGSLELTDSGSLSGAGIDLSGDSVTTGPDATITSTANAISGGYACYIRGYGGPATLGASVTATDAPDLNVDILADDVTVNGDISASGNVSITANNNDVTVSSTSSITSDSDSSGAGTLYLLASGSLRLTDSGSLSGAGIDLSGNSVTTGSSAMITSTANGATSYGVKIYGTSAITLGASVTATSAADLKVFIESSTDVTVNGDISASGNVDIYATNDVTISNTSSITADWDSSGDGRLRFLVDGNFDATDSGALSGAGVELEATSVTTGSSATITSTANEARFGNAVWIYGTGAITLGASVTATSAADLKMYIESSTDVTVNGDIGASGKVDIYAFSDATIGNTSSITADWDDSGDGKLRILVDGNLDATDSGALSGAGVDLEGTSVNCAGAIDHGSGGTTVTLGDANGAISSIISGSGTLAKNGSGTLDLQGDNTYTGATSVNTGTLLVTGSTSASSAVTVATGATLGGTGTVGGTVNADGTVAPGMSPGVLATGNVSFIDNSNFDLEIGGTSAGIGAGFHDQLNVSGTVVIGDNVTLLQSSFGGFVPVLGNSFVIINNDASDAVSGHFVGLPEGTVMSNFLGSGVDATITYMGDTGNDVVIKTLEVSITATDASAIEGADNGEFTVTLKDAHGTPTNAPADIQVTFSVGGTAIEGTDFAAIGTTATISAGSSTAVVTIDTSGDTATTFEGDESVIVTLQSADNGVAVGTPDNATVTITDDDASSYSVSIVATDASAIEGADNGEFTVTLEDGGGSPVNAPQDIQVTVTVGGTATQGTDYATIGTTATISSGSSTQTVIIDTSGDTGTTFEGDESVIVTLQSADNGVAVGTPDNATVTIIDDDSATVSISKVIDGAEPSTNGRFRVTLSQTAPTDIVVYYTVSGSATQGSDYSPLSGNATILNGGLTANIDVIVLDDGDLEGRETVILTLTGTDNPAVTVSPTNNEDTVYINDDEQAQVSISQVSDGAEPGTDGRFRVTISQAAARDVVVDYTIVGSATSGVDYTALSGSLTIGNGDTTADVDVAVIDDTDLEGSETVILTLTGTDNTAVTVDPGGDQATVTITDNEIGTVSITPVDDGSEAGPTNGKFRVTLTQSVAYDVVVSYTVVGTATAGSDYLALPGNVTVLAGSFTAEISVPVIDDADVEGTETVEVTLTGTDNDAVSVGSANDTATVDIGDNESATVSISKVTDGSEAGPTNGRFRVTLSQTAEHDVTVSYTVSGSATPGVDYSALSGNVIVIAGPITADIAVWVFDDVVVEGTEAVILTLTGTDNAAVTVGASDTASLDIADNDTATLPTVTTTEPSAIMQTTAVSGGEVTSDGGAAVTARGVCWSTSENPTTADSHTIDGAGTGAFTSTMTGLRPNTTYDVRAYATNSAGTAYGPAWTFTTKPTSVAPSTLLLLDEEEPDSRRR
ncbi:MAG: Calx-beta domain-containing protein [Thermodesulfobacteriota bacterium]|nr:Calx-beta domain-containing protein [Thermodesulfobacteriota bacterium]